MAKGRKVDDTDSRDIEIALTLSGGGYRAAVFHLGVLSYLYHLKLDDGTRLLDHVTVMSTISGGTITGLQYLLALSKGGELSVHLSDIYNKLINNNLADKLLKKVSDKKSKKDLSIIKELGNVYDEVFFEGLSFSEINRVVQESHVHHYSAYSTDISNALPFRFQSAHSKYGDVVIGNEVKQVSRKKADGIRLADIQAASSCFPIAFEPINYPRDFFNIKPNDEFAQSSMQTMLMDGGIIDNQGIDYLIEANRQMAGDEGDFRKGIDLAIISDASNSSDSEPAKLPLKHLWLRKIWSCIKTALYYISFLFLVVKLLSLLKYSTVNRIEYSFFVLAILLAIVGVALDGHFIPLDIIHYCNLYAYLYSIASTSVFIGLIFLIAKCFMPKTIKKSDQFEIPKGLVWKINFSQYYRLISKRYDSFSKVVSTVMMGHIRKKNIEMITENNRWTNRFVIPYISTLTSNGPWKNDAIAKGLMNDSKAITANSDEASTFHSTLWFSKADKLLDVPKHILACGQYTMCYELYLWSIRSKRHNHIKVLNQLQSPSMKEKLLNDWNEFKADPMVLTNLSDIK